MKRFLAQVVSTACLSTCLELLSHGQGGRRDSPPKPGVSNSRLIKTTRAGKGKKSARNQSAKDKLASLTVIVNPSDSALLLNDQQVEGPTVKGLKPGPYILIVRHQGYRDGLRAIVLMPGENPTINMTLEPIRGTLNVTPSVGGTVIIIQRAGLTNDDGKGRYIGAVEHLQLAPGDYEMTVSKEGYQSVTRKFSIEAAAIVFLEPQLQVLAVRLDSERTTAQPLNPKPEERSQISSGEAFTPALVRKKISPTYSRAARAANTAGLVTVSIQIDEEGNVKKAKAIEGPLLLRQAAENAARQWKFDPARRNGRAVPDAQQIRFLFQRQ